MRVERGKVSVRRGGTDKGRMPGGEGEKVGAIVEAEVRGGVVVGLVEGEVQNVQVHEPARDVGGAAVQDEVVEESLARGTAGVDVEVVARQ